MRSYFKIVIYVAALCFASTALALPSGLDYQQISPDNTNIVHVLKVDPSIVTLIAARAQDANNGLESVANIAHQFNAIAGINGGFFLFANPESGIGLPAGVLKINQRWYGIAFKARGAIGWDPKTQQYYIDRLQTRSNLQIDTLSLPIHAMNRVAKQNKGYLISDSYLEEIAVEPHTAISIQNDKVVQISSTGNLKVPRNGYVYHGDLNAQKLQFIKNGATAKIQVQILPQFKPQQAAVWNNLPFIVGGGPVLILDGKKITDYSSETSSSDFINNRHARTAIGILSNKKIVMVVVEKLLLSENTGMTLAELTNLMQQLGCVHALNLDGGGSSSMYLDSQFNASFNIVHRPVADAILVLK